MRRTTLHLTIILILFALLGGCVMNRANPEPQTIVLRKDAGHLIQTLYVTGADFRAMCHAEKNENQSEFFAQSLPVWSGRVTASGESLPSKTNPYPDAVASATRYLPGSSSWATAGAFAMNRRSTQTQIE